MFRKLRFGWGGGVCPSLDDRNRHAIVPAPRCLQYFVAAPIIPRSDRNANSAADYGAAIIIDFDIALRFQLTRT